MSFDLATTVINTNVVRSLMVLRGFTRQQLAVAAGVREENLRAWLASSDGSELCLALRNQMQVLRTLGVDGKQPRSDTVHLWHLNEAKRAARVDGMNALEIALGAFGPAELIHFSRDSDQALAFSEDVYFGLRFQRFRVILRVTPGFLRDVRFSPSDLKDLGWADINPVCMLPGYRYEQLQKADITWQEFEDFVKGQVELAKWERLHLLAREHDISADAIAKWVLTEVRRKEINERLANNPPAAAVAAPAEKQLADNVAASQPAPVVPVSAAVKVEVAAAEAVSPVAAVAPAAATVVAAALDAAPVVAAAPVAAPEAVVAPAPKPAVEAPAVKQEAKADPTPFSKADIVRDESSNVVSHQLFLNRAAR